jgi:hypothetical protein
VEKLAGGDDLIAGAGFGLARVLYCGATAGKQRRTQAGEK